jgi:transposase
MLFERCRFVLETVSLCVRQVPKRAARRMTLGERLSFHQTRGGPLMEGLKKWFDPQLVERKAEPNSGLGKAIQLSSVTGRLTLFLREAGAPLDNNLWSDR